MTKLIFKAALSEPSRQARCLALFQVGMVCVRELRREQPSDKVTLGLDILLASLKVCLSVCGIDVCIVTN